MKHTFKTTVLIFLVTVGMISCSKDKEIIPQEQTSISVPFEPSESLPTLPIPKKQTGRLTAE